MNAHAALASAPANPQPRRRTINRIFTIVGALGLGLLLVYGITTFGTANNHRTVQSLDVTGISTVRVDTAASNVHVRFGDTAQAELELAAAEEHKWRFIRDGDTLLVERNSIETGWCFFNCGTRHPLILTLPAELEGTGLEGDFFVDAGQLKADGEYGAVRLEVNAGSGHLNVSTSKLDVDVDAGSAEVQSTGTEEITMKVAAGAIDGQFYGDQPRSTTLRASAGRLDAVLPHGAYRLDASKAAGTIRDNLLLDAGSPNLVTAEVAAGTINVSMHQVAAPKR